MVADNLPTTTLADEILTPGEGEQLKALFVVAGNPILSAPNPRGRLTKAFKELDLLVSMDLFRSETAELADIHLQVRPGNDAWLLAALGGVLVQEDLIDHAWMQEHVVDAGQEALAGSEQQRRVGRQDQRLVDVQQVVQRTGNNALMGGVLAIFFIFIFLRNWRPTLTIPGTETRQSCVIEMMDVSSDGSFRQVKHLRQFRHTEPLP